MPYLTTDVLIFERYNNNYMYDYIEGIIHFIKFRLFNQIVKLVATRRTPTNLYHVKIRNEKYEEVHEYIVINVIMLPCI